MAVDARPHTPTPEEQREIRESHRDERDRKRLGWEIVTAVALCAYTVLTLIVICFTNQSLKLSKNALKASNAGVIVPDIGLSGDVLNVVFINRGKGNVVKFSTRYKITQERLPGESYIWTSEWIPAQHDLIQPDKGPNNYTVLDGFEKADWDLFLKQGEAMRVEGTFQYDNGFDETIRQSFCLVLIGQNQAFPCEDLQARLRFNLPPEQRWAKEKH